MSEFPGMCFSCGCHVDYGVCPCVEPYQTVLKPMLDIIAAHEPPQRTFKPIIFKPDRETAKTFKNMEKRKQLRKKISQRKQKRGY